MSYGLYHIAKQDHTQTKLRFEAMNIQIKQPIHSKQHSVVLPNCMQLVATACLRKLRQERLDVPHEEPESPSKHHHKDHDLQQLLLTQGLKHKGLKECLHSGLRSRHVRVSHLQ